MPKTAPNQRIVKIHRIKPGANYLGIKNEHWQAAARNLGAQGLMLYLYLSSNANNFDLALSPAAIRKAIGMPPSTYRDHFQNLINKGYLVQKGKGNIYDFFECPERATHALDDDTADCSSETSDNFSEARNVDNKTAEDREINKDNYINKINNCCGEKQVSPSQSKTEFVF